MDEKRRQKLTLALGIALLPPIWAVLAPVIGVTTGAVALICAGLYVALNPNVELYCTLFLMGGLAVLIGESLPRFIYTPAWLCGWAIGLTIMGPLKVAEIGTLPIQIGAAMLAGVFYVGVGVDAFQKWLLRLWGRHEQN